MDDDTEKSAAPDVERLLRKAREPSLKGVPWHRHFHGKIELIPKCSVSSFDDFAVYYTPGVARPCLSIGNDRDEVNELTNRWNTVAVASNGTRVLGLGNIGPYAGLPVMEGKGLLFKYLGGVDAQPLMIDTEDPDRFIETVKILEPTFGGINLEDIRVPDCFYILERLREEMDIPVWHDDQQGTASIQLAGTINALEVVGKKMGDARFAIIGVGAANTAYLRVLSRYGARRENIVLVDTGGIIHGGREDLEHMKEINPWKYDFASTTNPDGITGGIREAMKGADVAVAASAPGPGVIRKEWVRGMNDDAIVFPVANPVPEIWPWEAKEAGARIVGTGRSDFPNQINNSLGFPGIFRGTLDVMATTITDEMAIAAAEAIAETAEEKGLSEDYIVPTMDDWEVFIKEAEYVGRKAVEQGLARRRLSASEIRERARETIELARSKTRVLMEKGLIPAAPGDLPPGQI